MVVHECATILVLKARLTLRDLQQITPDVRSSQRTGDGESAILRFAVVE